MRGSLAFTLIGCAMACLVLHAQGNLIIGHEPALRNGSGPRIMQIGVGARPLAPCNGMVDDFGFPIGRPIAFDSEPSRFI